MCPERACAHHPLRPSGPGRGPGETVGLLRAGYLALLDKEGRRRRVEGAGEVCVQGRPSLVFVVHMHATYCPGPFVGSVVELCVFSNSLQMALCTRV